VRITSGKIDIYTHIIEDETGSEMKVFAAIRHDVFLSMNNSPAALIELRNIFQEFLKEYLPHYYQGRVRDAEHRVNALVKEKATFKKEITKDSEKIEQLKLEIEELSLKLAANRAKLDLAESKLKKRKEKLNRIRAQVKHF
jgi:chromosome segregation ATPase